MLDELGIDDPAKFKAEREAERRRLAELEQAQEEKRRSEMSEVERLKADVAAKDARIAELEAQLTRAHGDAQATKFDVIVSRTIGEHVDPSMHEDAQAALMRHLRTLPKDQVRKFGEPETRTFFAKLVKDKPKYAKDAAAPPKAPAAPPRRPLSNGAPPKGATPPGPAKTPGNGMKPASQMTKTELRAAWEKYGARAPG